MESSYHSSLCQQSAPHVQEQVKRTVVLKVIKKSRTPQKYDGRSGEMKYFNIIGAAGNTSYILRVYQLHKFTLIRVGFTYKFSNCIEKPESLWVVSSSSIGIAKMVDVNDDLPVLPLPEEEPPTGSKRTLAMALGSPSKSTVQAKIVKVSPVKFTCNGTLPVRCLGVKDESGHAKIALFDKLAEQTYSPNTAIEMTGVNRKVYNQKAQLAVSRQTTCQFIPDEMVQVTVDDKDEEIFQKDGDFSVPVQEEELIYEIDALNEVVSYDACSAQACRKKKLVEGVCPTCQGTGKIVTMRAKVSVVREDFSKETTLFENDLLKLFGQLPKERTDDDKLFSMVELLPISFSAKLAGSSFYNITKK